MNIAQLLAIAARSFAERPAVAIGADILWTYSEYSQRVARLAGGLRALPGTGAGDRVAIAMKNCPEYTELLWAIWHAGLCAVPINAKLHPREFAYIFTNSGARVAFVTEDIAESVAPLVQDVEELDRVIIAGSAEYKRLVRGGPFPVETVNPQDPAWLFYTSGTTGRPKGATLTHRNLLEMTLRYYADIDMLSHEDCIIHAAPLSHGSGLFSLSHVAKASLQIIPASQGFDEAELFDLLRRYENVTLFVAPTLLARMTDHAAGAGASFEHFKTLIYGGAPMYLEDLKKALLRFGPCLFQGYGQGETPNTISHLSKALHADTRHPRYEQRLASVGIPRTGVEVRVVDGEDCDVSPGTIGEVIVRSEVTMSGYWNNAEATAVALRGGWLHTGDLATMGDDGFLTLKDRSKDVIISGGTNIYPREVEEVLLRHPSIMEVAVIGRRSKEWGEEVVAFVVKRAGYAISEAELDQLCLKHIARFKRPKAYRFIDTLPKNNYGKILKTELRALI